MKKQSMLQRVRNASVVKQIRKEIRPRNYRQKPLVSVVKQAIEEQRMALR